MYGKLRESLVSRKHVTRVNWQSLAAQLRWVLGSQHAPVWAETQQHADASVGANLAVHEEAGLSLGGLTPPRLRCPIAPWPHLQPSPAPFGCSIQQTPPKLSCHFPKVTS